MSKNATKTTVLKILPVKKDPEKPSHLNPVLPAHPFCCCIAAPPRGGKTNLICNVLANPNFYYCGNEHDKDNPSYFDEIHYFSPSSKFDKTCKKVLGLMDNVIQIDEMEDLENSANYLQVLMDLQKNWDVEVEKRPRLKILLVYDDMVGLLEKTGLATISTKFRHYDFSVIAVSQSYRRLPLTLRNCMTCLIFFNLMNAKEHQKVFDEHGQNVPEFWTHLKLLDRKYQFLFYHIEDQKLYHNFETLLFSKDDYLDSKAVDGVKGGDAPAPDLSKPPLLVRQDKS